ncbi:KAP family P-loop NTPase fold protein [Actinocatenispora thailandica]|uniref:KAP family P-loop NTPase fold protein n=1 Tax=Actinocatenispora thailandica TaxID=227318 RepID=UPI001EF364EB|nr:P-loop NTPase fold protein [Actinocatenispora thailandica]
MSLVAERDGHAVVDLAIATSFAPAPISPRRAERRMPVLVALSDSKPRGLRRNEHWILASVGDSRGDGQFMLDPRTESPAARARLMDAAGAVIDSHGDVVGIATDRKMRSVDWLNAVRSIDSRRSSWRSYDQSTAARSLKEPDAVPVKDDQPGDTPPWGAAHPLPRLATDAATIEDRLTRRRYVDAIATFLRHPDTRPPLTIGIHGSWGVGKTSLMRMVQDELDPGAATGTPIELRYGRRRRRVVTNGEVIQATKRPPASRPKHAAPDAETDGWRPTVWFNPWMYQNGDQVWAGLAHTIIGQVTDRLPRGDRERFWLRLNLSRIDAEAIRRRWYGIVARQLLPTMLWFLVLLAAAALTLLVLAWLRPAWTDALREVGRWTGIGGGIVATSSGVGRWLWSRFRPAAPTFARLLDQPSPLCGSAEDASGLPATDPGYQGRLGFLHLVQSDMHRVLDLVATPGRPLVVFVDDLDRCSPGTVAQVIEAINLFLAGEFGNCVFVLGMEPTAVAASVATAYHELSTAETGRGELGWRFLAKFVQLPLRIPEPDPETELGAYLDQLLGGDPAPPRVPPDERIQIGETVHVPTEASVSDPQSAASVTYAPAFKTLPGAEVARQKFRADVATLHAAILDRLSEGGVDHDELRAAALDAQRTVLGIDGEPAPETLAAAERVFAERYSDRDAAEPIRAALPSLGTGNPREIKRYVNLFRFYTFLAERLRLRGAAVPEPASIAKLAAFTIRWPQLVSAPATATAIALAELESAATGEDDRWCEGLTAVCPGLPTGTAGTLRAFLRTGPAIGVDGFRLR